MVFFLLIAQQYISFQLGKFQLGKMSKFWRYNVQRGNFS